MPEKTVWHVNFFCVTTMIRLFYHSATSKLPMQEVINCWLTYVTSQPVDIDVKMAWVFLLRYFGIIQIVAAYKTYRNSIRQMFEKEEVDEQESSGNLIAG